MPATDLSSSSHHMSKRRLACERCRNQKLKCIRRHENDFEPCLRCLQAHTECIISLRKTPGRPAGRNNSDQQGSIGKDLDSHSKNLDGSEDQHLGFVPVDGSLTSEDHLEMPSEFSLDGMGNDSNTIFSACPFLMNDYTQDFTGPLLSYPDPASDFSLTWTSSDDSNNANSSQSFHLLDQNSDPGFQLSRLQQRLAKQLFLLRSLSWDITAIMKLESSSCGCQRQSHEGSRDFNALSTTFEMISEFEHLLNMLRSTKTHRETTGNMSFRPEMNVSYSLIAISCYLQVVYIYNCIFSYVLEQAQGNPAVKDFLLNSTPGISLGGFLIPSPKNVLGRLFVQLMQLKIRPIELALGLPEDYRISKDDDSENACQSRGLLEGKQGESLLAAIKNSDIGETNDGSTPDIIKALKKKIIELELLQ